MVSTTEELPCMTVMLRGPSDRGEVLDVDERCMVMQHCLLKCCTFGIIQLTVFGRIVGDCRPQIADMLYRLGLHRLMIMKPDYIEEHEETGVVIMRFVTVGVAL
jgi:hypothetical protein